MTNIAQNQESDQREIAGTLKKFFHSVWDSEAIEVMPGRKAEGTLCL